MSPASFKRKVRGKVPCKRDGDIEIYHIEDLDKWDASDRATSSSNEAASGTSLAPHRPGGVRIGPLERQMAKKLLGDSPK
jgi:hypothetical protein